MTKHLFEFRKKYDFEHKYTKLKSYYLIGAKFHLSWILWTQLNVILYAIYF